MCTAARVIKIQMVYKMDIDMKTKEHAASLAVFYAHMWAADRQWVINRLK